MLEIQSIADFFQGGGPFMWAILTIFAMAVAVMAERFWVLYMSRDGGGSLNDEESVDQLLHLVRNGHGPKAIRQKGQEAGLFGRIAARILPHRNDDRAQMRNAADEAVLVESSRITKRLGYLPMLANVAILFGLLGTIFGLKEAFEGVGAASAVERTQLLSSGIAIALNTTAFGLLAAVPSLIGYTFLKGRAESVLDAADEFSLRVVNALIDTLPAEPVRTRSAGDAEAHRQLAGD